MKRVIHSQEIQILLSSSYNLKQYSFNSVAASNREQHLRHHFRLDLGFAHWKWQRGWIHTIGNEIE